VMLLAEVEILNGTWGVTLTPNQTPNSDQL